MFAALAVLVFIGLVLAIGDIAANGGGLKFFLFRNDGAGAGNAGGLGENQGPGQADAPGAHKAAVQKAATKAAADKAAASKK
jgi:anaerobic selenocysteine-containing dehydrogenase